METQLYYRPIDLATAEHLERRLGQVSAYAHSQMVRVGAQTSEGHAERPIPLLTAQEIMQLRDEEVIGFHRRLPPFRLTRADWRASSILRQRRELKAPVLARVSSLADVPFDHKQPPTRFPNGYIDRDINQEETEREEDRLN